MDVRLAALECVVDFVSVEGSFADLLFLIDLIENDPVGHIDRDRAQ